MAEMLVQWTGLTHAPSAPKRGDIRYIGPNGNDWGTHCDLRLWLADGRDAADFPDDYAVVQVVGVSVPNLNKLYRQGLRDAVEGDPEYDADEPANNIDAVVVHRYAWRMNFSELTPAQRATVTADRYVEIPLAKFQEVSEHKVKIVRFDPDDPEGEGDLRLPGTG
jgi:hypothetical protein